VHTFYDRHIKISSAVNERTGGLLVPSVKMLKAWNRTAVFGTHRHWRSRFVSPGLRADWDYGLRPPLLRDSPRHNAQVARSVLARTRRTGWQHGKP
jgi:hypothetical protein